MKHFIFILFIVIGFSAFAQEKFDDGPFFVHFENGNLKTEGQYKNNLRVGDWKGYYKTGQLRTEFSYNSKGKRTRLYKQYFKDGTVMYQLKKVGNKFYEVKYYENGGLFFERILENGYYKEYYEDGVLKVESNYVNSQLSGLWTLFYENGQKEWEVSYKDGYKDGPYRYYNETGELGFSGTLKKDVKIGKEIHYNKEGYINWKGVYLDGKPSGVWINYDSEGNIVHKLKYKNGKLKNGDDVTALNFNQIKLPDGILEKLPVFPGCEEYKSNRQIRECDAKKISEFVSRRFNTSFAKEMGLSGRQRVNAIFKIDKTGKVIDIRARAEHISLSSEAIRVLGLLPQFVPGTKRGKPVDVPYSLPIIFVIQ